MRFGVGVGGRGKIRVTRRSEKGRMGSRRVRLIGGPLAAAAAAAATVEVVVVEMRIKKEPQSQADCPKPFY